MEKKTIKLKYTDHSSKVVKQEDGPFYDILSKQYNVIFSDDPEYVIYGPFGDEHLKYSNSIKIFYTGECITPDFNLCDYAIGYDYLDFGDRYFRYPLWLRYGYDQNKRMMEKHLNIDANLADREFCSMVISNSFADSMRDKIFDSVCSYKKVDSGGKYKNNINKPEGIENKLEFQSKHKFALALENCSYPGYTTEKLMEAFEAKTVPIYWGDPEVARVFNPKSFINFHDFDSIDDFLNEINRIDNDDEEYLKMLSTPALIDDVFCVERQEIMLKNFIFSIFNQDISEAHRRNMECWGLKYNTIQYRKKQIYDKYEHARGIVKKILHYPSNIKH